VIGVPDELVEMLKLYREEQVCERRRAGQLWREQGWVFASPVGEALNPNSDYHEWKALLKAAGVRDGRLHDARHTAAPFSSFWGARAHSHVDHGVNQHVAGGSLSARDRPDPAGCCSSSGGPLSAEKEGE
jgi:integrase